MTEEQTNQQTEPTNEPLGDAWREVGQQFQTLGESLAAAFRATWEDEETRQHLQGMQDGLEAMVKDIGQAMKEATASPEAQKARGEFEKAAESLRSAGQQTLKEAQPRLLSALHQVNEELQKMISRLEQRGTASETETSPDEQGAE
jgi:Skp family chaperone for outer membrane proteins